MSYFVYILECADGTYYVGTTNDLKRRLLAHNTSAIGAKYTRGRRPVKLVFSEEHPTKSAALKREIEIKRWKKQEKTDLVATSPTESAPSPLKYEVRLNSRAKRLRLTVYPDRRIVVTSPRHHTPDYFEKFVREKEDWLRKQHQFFDKAQPSGRIVDDKKSYAAYKEAALRLVERKIEQYNQHYNFHYDGLRITNSKSQWGSCSAKRILSFNYRIAFLTTEQADYLIVHELCHLKEFNHSPRFWALVAEAIPDYQVARKQLKKEGFSLY